jgi:hypothetical protein
LHLRLAVVFAWIALLVSPQASATGPTLAFPPALVSANTERSFPGLWEPLEAGAVLVRTTDPSAVWYNPAGIVGTDRSGLNANAPGYQLTAYWGSSDNRPAQGSNLRGLPSFVGAILGREVIPWRNVRVGFGLTNPISAQQNLTVGQETAPGQRSAYAVNSDLESFQGSGAIAWEPWPSLRLGLSLGMSYDTISSNAQTNAEFTTAQSYSGSLDTSSISANTQQFVSAIGTQWAAFPWLSLGAVVRPPAVKLLGSSSLNFDGILNSAQAQQEHFQGSGSFEFRQPLQINFGATTKIGMGNVEVNLFWHQASGAYNLFGSTGTLRSVSATPGGGAPVVVNSPFPDIRTESRAILNASVGGNYQFRENWWFHGGLYIDQSPTAANDPFFQPVDFYGLRAGCSLRQPTGLSGSLGVGYELGLSSRPPGTGNLLGNTPTAEGNLNIHTFSLLLAVGYRF